MFIFTRYRGTVTDRLHMIFALNNLNILYNSCSYHRVHGDAFVQCPHDIFTYCVQLLQLRVVWYQYN